VKDKVTYDMHDVIDAYCLYIPVIEIWNRRIFS